MNENGGKHKDYRAVKWAELQVPAEEHTFESFLSSITSNSSNTIWHFHWIFPTERFLGVVVNSLSWDFDFLSKNKVWPKSCSPHKVFGWRTVLSLQASDGHDSVLLNHQNKDEQLF